MGNSKVYEELVERQLTATDMRISFVRSVYGYRQKQLEWIRSWWDEPIRLRDIDETELEDLFIELQTVYWGDYRLSGVGEQVRANYIRGLVLEQISLNYGFKALFVNDFLDLIAATEMWDCSAPVDVHRTINNKRLSFEGSVPLVVLKHYGED